jgi:sulfite exporter TauE/SafE/copper chaperone CopZ
MSQTLVLKKLQVKGMTCTGCETRIEGALIALPGVEKVRAQVKDGSVEVTYDPAQVSPETFEKAITKLGYTVGSNEQPEVKKSGVVRIAGLIALLMTFFLLGSRLGWFQVFNFFPMASKDTGYGMLFVIGLLTSVHCVAMCGGINLSQCISGAGGQGRFGGFWPSIKYNLGRVISYTVIGGIVGALGSVVQFSSTARGIMQLLAGVFMVFMGLSLSGLVPALARFTPHLPKALGLKIAKEKKRSNSPLYVGLLNGLMPCGPLQAMQLYALSTGSLWGGALSMLLFSLGTVPLMFALGALSSILSRKFTKHMVTVGAVLVVVMGISMFQNGLALSGINTSSGVAQSEAAAAEDKAESSQPAASAAAQGQAPSNENAQEISSQLTGYGYPAITVKAGIPVKWTMNAPKGSLNGCNSSLIIPEYKIEKKLAEGDNVIEFTPTRTGTFTYSCWMGMIRSTIKVVENDGATAAPSGFAGQATTSPAIDSSAYAIGPEATDDPNALPIAPGGCCGGSVSGPQATTEPDTLPITPGGCCGN